MFAAAEKDMIAIIARRPLLSSFDRWTLSFAASTEEKSIGGKIMVGRSPPLV